MNHRTYLRIAAILPAMSLALCCIGCGQQAAPTQGDATATPDATGEAAVDPQAAPTAQAPQSSATAGAQPVEADVNIEAIAGLPDDFKMGVDISSLPAELESGVVYHDFAGNEITDIAGFCALLKDCGVTHVRVRVWNDPFDAEGHGYGGGNNTADTAVAIAQGCADAGLAMLVDFHGSDFWADPAKQMAPKAWQDYTLAQKADALRAFITQTLDAIAQTGAAVEMVQVGNETNNGFVGESDPAAMCTLFKAGIEAVKEAGAQAVIHVTDPNKGTLVNWAKTLQEQGVGYDILATSYYPAYHGTLENLTDQLRQVREDYGKQVLVVESSYPYTIQDTDSGGQTVLEGDDLNWPFTPQGQATYLRELMAAANEGGAIGFFYWEPAWITVGDMTGLTEADAQAQLAANRKTWEEHGSGWASSYAAEYDPEDAGQFYGGSAMDNQAFFDAAGNPLPALRIWQYVRTGAFTKKIILEEVKTAAVSCAVGSALTMPETVDVVYNNGTRAEPVVWNEAERIAVDTAAPGEYTVTGVVSLTQETADGATQADTYAIVTVQAENLIPDADAASFEKPDGFVLEGEGLFDLPDGETPYEGESCLHWWHEQAQKSTVTYQGPITLSAGTYEASVMAQGMAGDKVTLEVLDADGNVLATGEPAVMADWQNWQQAKVTFTLPGETNVQLRLVIEMQAGGWGTCDCLSITAAL